MRENKAKVIRMIFLIVFAPIIFPIGALLIGCERIAEFIFDLKLSEKWTWIWEWAADHVLPWGGQEEDNYEQKA